MHLLAFDGRPEDFEWTPAEMPAQPAQPTLPTMKISPVPISAEELTANAKEYCEKLVRFPNWQEELAKQNLEAKAAKRAAREARKAERRKAA
jgi:hypothetical protein